EATALYRQGLQLNPGDDVTRIDLAVLLEGQGKEEEAAALLRQVLRQNAQYHYAREHLAKMLERQGKAEAAVDVYRTALSANAGDDFARMAFAELLRRLGRTREADVLELRGFHALLESQGKWEEVAALYLESLAKNPKDVRARTDLGRLYERRG